MCQCWTSAHTLQPLTCLLASSKPAEQMQAQHCITLMCNQVCWDSIACNSCTHLLVLELEDWVSQQCCASRLYLFCTSRDIASLRSSFDICRCCWVTPCVLLAGSVPGDALVVASLVGAAAKGSTGRSSCPADDGSAPQALGEANRLSKSFKKSGICPGELGISSRHAASCILVSMLSSAVSPFIAPKHALDQSLQAL